MRPQRVLRTGITSNLTRRFDARTARRIVASSMNAEHLLTHFDRLVDAPDAIPRLRRFILDLAVRGKLVEQDPNEGTGSSLLTEIERGQAKHVSGRRLKKTHNLSFSDVPFKMPENWALVRLGQALDLVNGRAFKPSDWTQTGLPIVRIQNLNNPSAAFNRYDGEVKEKFLIDSGDFLISWSGTPGTSFGAHIWTGGPAVSQPAHLQGYSHWECVRATFSEVGNQCAIARID